mmetsp:Transcript_10410/g.46959  ORF Transcript_10410/g.46959 Transcript_10410/m.46959 type:complete len:84 (-) Transcript_10410:36-287(-)
MRSPMASSRRKGGGTSVEEQPKTREQPRKTGGKLKRGRLEKRDIAAEGSTSPRLSVSFTFITVVFTAPHHPRPRVPLSWTCYV